MLGFLWGKDAWGWPVAILCSVAGFYLGGVAGRIPIEIGLWSLMRKLHRTDSSVLREKLQSEYFLSHFIVAVLKMRGEPSGELQDHTLRLLLSPSFDERWHGWRTLNLCFPETAEALRDINPKKPSEEDFGRIRGLMTGERP